MRYIISFGYTTKRGFVKQSDCSFVCDGDGDIDSAVDMMCAKFEEWMDRNPSKAKRRTAQLYLDGTLIKIKHCDCA